MLISIEFINLPQSMAIYKKYISKDEAFQKIKHYCSYQERNHTETKEKLYGFGLRKYEVEELVSKLVEEDYLNELRFATSFARGKFRMKQWGRVKIKYELKQKKVSEYCIKKALLEIDEKDYTVTIDKLTLKKWNSLKGNHYISRQIKTQNYLISKGYEINLILEAIKKLKD
jgi:regulatory protein